MGNAVRIWREVPVPAHRQYLELGDSTGVGKLNVWSRGKHEVGTPSRIPTGGGNYLREYGCFKVVVLLSYS